MPGLMGRIEVLMDQNVTDIINHTNSVLHDDIYNLNKEFYEGYQWVACLDSTTCLICANLDNQIFDRLPNQEGEGTQAPEQPIHQNCRCIMVPILQGDSAATQAGPNYHDWFEGQDEKTKLDILGPSRYREYLNGKPIIGFVKDDKIITLKELGVNRITRKNLFDELSGNAKPQVITGETKLTGNEFNIRKLTLTDINKISRKPDYEYKTDWKDYKDLLLDDITVQLKDKYSIDFIGGKNMDISVARKMMYNFDRMDERFPGLMAHTEKLQYRPSKAYYNKTFAYFKPVNNSVYITIKDSAMASNDALNEFYKKQMNMKQWPEGGNGITPIIHEWGHLFHSLFNKAGLADKNLADAIGFTVDSYSGIETMIWQKTREYIKSFGYDFGKEYVKNNLSSYANASEMEFLSEAFSEYLTSGKPRPIAKIVGGIMEQVWREYARFL
jgi:hypothetical protein